MKSTLLIFVLLLSTSSFCFGQKVEAKDDSTKKEAERLWELAIRAKGGREKLQAIENMVVSSRSKVQYSVFKTYTHVVESLFVFPDKEWRYDDNRPSVFGLWITMYDYKAGMKYVRVTDTQQAPFNGLVPFEKSEQNQIGSRSINLVFDLMETSWLRPSPQLVITGKVRGKSVDIVQTILNGDRFDFALDCKTHLPIQIRHLYYSPMLKKALTNTSNFSDYAAFDGIMMPTTSNPEGESGKEVRSYKFNVKYDEDIFKRPPPFDSGGEAWKLKNN